MKKIILILFVLGSMLTFGQYNTVHRGGVKIGVVPPADTGDDFLTINRNNGIVRAYTLVQMQNLFSGSSFTFSGGLIENSGIATLGGPLGSNRSLFFERNSFVYSSGINSTGANEIRYRMGTTAVPTQFQFQDYLTSELHRSPSGNREMHFGLLASGATFQMRSRSVTMRLFAVGGHLELASNSGIRFQPPGVAPAEGMVWTAQNDTGLGTWRASATIPLETTFAPTLTANGVNYTFNTLVATEYKIGKLVFFNISINAIEFSGTPSGVLILGGFTYNAKDFTMGIIGNFGGSTFANPELLAPLIMRDGTIQFLDKTNSVTGIQNIDFTFGRIRVSGTYITD